MPTKALLVRQAWQVWQAHPAWQDLLVLQVHRDCKAWLAPRVKSAPKARKVHRVWLGRLV